MDQVEKDKSKNMKKEAKSYVQQIYVAIKILNGTFKDFPDPDPEQGKEVLENFIPRLGKVVKKLDCIEPQLHSSHTSTDTLEELFTALNIFRIHLKTTRDHLKLFDLSELIFHKSSGVSHKNHRHQNRLPRPSRLAANCEEQN
jgi:hypothetical protein